VKEKKRYRVTFVEVVGISAWSPDEAIDKVSKMFTKQIRAGAELRDIMPHNAKRSVGAITSRKQVTGKKINFTDLYRG